jgi:hypothetical protein
MSYRSLGRALPIFIVLLFYSNTAPAFETRFTLPCTITYSGQPPIETSCELQRSMSQGLLVEKIKTPNGKVFIIQNDQSDAEEWYLDHQRAAEISDQPITCYQNQQVKLCL